MEKQKNECPKNATHMTVWHGTSLGRAKKILAEGFADTRKISQKMREGMGGVGENGVTYFFIAPGKKVILEQNDRPDIEYNPVKSGAKHHAYRVANDDNDDPAIIEAEVCLFHPILENDSPKIVPEIKLAAEKKVKSGDSRWFRTYSMNRNSSAMSNLQSVATENLSIREIMDEIGADAIFEGDNVIVISDPNKSLMSKRIAVSGKSDIDQWQDWSVINSKKAEKKKSGKIIIGKSGKKRIIFDD